MATVMKMHWAGVTPEQYDEARRIVNWEGDAPEGGIYHVAWFTDEGLHVVDVWDSAESFQHFVDDRLMPGVAEVGIEGEPTVKLFEAHATFAPGYTARV